ncbi:MAG: beta-lactamase family protein [Crocinitomicaceae bacterium]|nr:beta-lactamase family protein [Crocinitomicaceae bacterium]
MFRKILKYTGLSILGLLLLLSTVILISGKSYIFKAVWATYFRGQTGPGIYDLDVFYYSTIPASDQPEPWKTFDGIEHLTLRQEQKKYLEELETTSILVIHNNEIIYEEYWDEHNKEKVSNSFSVAKSYISVLIGIAIDKGFIASIDDPASKYLDWFTGDGKDKITIRHLLEMAGGLDWGESGGNPLSHNAEGYYGWDLLSLVKSLNAVEEPGVKLDYQSGNTQIIGFVLKEATGMTISEFAYEFLWSKIGSENDAHWSLDDEGGMEKAFCCLYATTRDFARLGRLINENGFYNGKMILSTSYISEMLTPARIVEEGNQPNDQYGLFYWLYPSGNDPVYYARGILGQYVISIPSQNIIIVRTGHKRDEKYEFEEIKNMEGIMPQYEKYIERIGHPSDLFLYIDIAYELLAQKNSLN